MINFRATGFSLRHVFVTGTDTGVGKTTISAGLCRALLANKIKVGVRKPIASGANLDAGQLRNDDALKLLEAAQVPLTSASYQQVNPFCFAPAIAPHIAAAEQGQQLTAEAIAQRICAVPTQEELVVIEGAGGWLVPLSATETMADVAEQLNAGVILVVGMQLGCINHALLTVADIQRRGLTLLGWIANQLTPAPMPYWQENFASLQQLIAAPCWANIPYQPNPAKLLEALTPLARHLAIENNLVADVVAAYRR